MEKLKDLYVLSDLLADNNILEAQQKILSYYEELEIDTLKNVKELIDYNNKMNYILLFNEIEKYTYEEIEEEIKNYESDADDVEVLFDDAEYEESNIVIKTSTTKKDIKGKVIEKTYYKISFADYDTKGIYDAMHQEFQVEYWREGKKEYGSREGKN